MADNVTGLPNRGSTYNGPNKTLSSSYGQSVGLEGKISQFSDLDSSSSAGVQTKRSDRLQTCILVRNVSGITLSSKRIVTWAAGYRGKRVDGYCKVADEEVAGVVDEYLPSGGARNYDLFWLQVKGPAFCLMSVTDVAAIAEGDRLVALTAANSTAHTASGRPRTYIATSSVTVSIAQVWNTIGQAMSAKVSNTTNTNVLVDLQLLK